VTITPKQCKAARELIGWSRVELARAAGVGQTTGYTLERGIIPQSNWVLAVLRATLEVAGIEFDQDGRGVRLREGTS
jgi:DNA-binding XRE family transcriptional regulator